MQSIFEVLEYGPIVAKDDDLGLLVTINGAYLNLWSVPYVGGHAVGWTNTDCRAVEPGVYERPLDAAVQAAYEWLAEIAAAEAS